MFRSLFTNTLISATAFLASALIPLLLVPLIVGHYGIAEYGLIVLTRILLPTGTFAIFDFGNSEIATQTIVRARHDRDWAQAGRRLMGLALITLTAGLIVSAGMALAAPFIGEFFNVPLKAQPGFIRVVFVTSGLFTFLLLTLIIEGVLKGFEAFKSLRVAEVSCTIVYGVAAVGTLFTGLGYEWIAFALLGSLAIRATTLMIIASRQLRGTGFKLGKPNRDDWQDLRLRCGGMIGNRLLSASQSQAAPLLITMFLGPSAVGIYDLITRFPRFLKVVAGLMSSAVLPVSSRLDVMGDAAGMRRLGELGLLSVVAVAAPICAWAASFSEPILRLWISSTYSVYWPWHTLMFSVPLINAITSFGGGALIGRPHVVAKLNRIALAQIILQFGLGLALMGLYGERAFILGQVVAVIASFPAQIWLVVVEKNLSWKSLRRHVTILGSFVALTAASLAVGAAQWIATIVELGLSLTIWMALSYFAIWIFILRKDERDAIYTSIRTRRK